MTGGEGTALVAGRCSAHCRIIIIYDLKTLLFFNYIEMGHCMTGGEGTALVAGRCSADGYMLIFIVLKPYYYSII